MVYYENIVYKGWFGIEITGLGAETSNNIMNQPISTPFYLDIKLMVPILLSTVAILVAGAGLCLCLAKSEWT